MQYSIINDPHALVTDLLTDGQAVYRECTHPPAGKSAEVARIRGTEPGQGAKALVCNYRQEGHRHYVLAVLAGDCQADLSRLAKALSVKKISLASPDEVMKLTGCVPGAIPPFSFHPELRLIADPGLFERYKEIAFNAGSLEHSVILNTQDYLRIAQPELVSFVREEAADSGETRNV